MYQYVKFESLAGENQNFSFQEKGERLISVKYGRELLLQKVKNSLVTEEPFWFMGAEQRLLIQKWIMSQKGSWREEKEFLENVANDIRIIDYDYSISTIEPSLCDDKIVFEKEKQVAILPIYIWEVKAKEYNPNKSRIATIEELMLFYAWRIAMRYWTIQYLTIDSRGMGNYKNSPASNQGLEKSGHRLCGGFRDGIGNTSKLVLKEDEIVVVGGDCNDDGKLIPAVHTRRAFAMEEYSSPVIVQRP